MEIENKPDTIEEIEKKIRDIEVTLQIPGLPDEFIAASHAKIDTYKTQIDCLKFY